MNIFEYMSVGENEKLSVRIYTIKVRNNNGIKR